MPTKIPLVHPGEILAEDFMAPRGLSANSLALDLHYLQTAYPKLFAAGER